MNVGDWIKISTSSRIVTVDGTEPEWWKKLKEPVPRELQCKKDQCSFAPEGHRRHGVIERHYKAAETRLIIQYLCYYKLIEYGKGISVWNNMNSRGYLTHRTPWSLNNHFKRTILKDINHYNLPIELEAKFLALRD